MAYPATRYRRSPLLRCCLLLPCVLKPGAHGFRLGEIKRRWTTAPYQYQYQGTRAAVCRVLSMLDEDEGGQPRISSVAELEALTVKQLKSYLKAYKLKQTGRKSELIKVLAESLGLSPTAKNGADMTSNEVLVAGKKRRSRNAPTDLLPTVEQVIGESAQRKTRSPDENDTQTATGKPIFDAEMATPEGFSSEPDPSSTEYSTNSPYAILPPPEEDMLRRKVIQDLMARRHLKYDLAEAFYPETYMKDKGPAPEGDMYAVFTPRAVRPWDSPHADRAETHLVVLLADVMGWEDAYTRNFADRVSEVCDAIVLVPDIFRGRPWSKDKPQEGYEEWRASHDPDTVSSDIRACVAHARMEFKPTSLALMGFCYGGGRALEEAAAGVVEADNVVAFYPTRYDIEYVAANIVCPVAAFFARNDELPGATVDDACALREGLLNNDKVRDFQLRLCPGADHGFVHRPRREDKQNAEDALLLATSWLDMYMAKYYPVRGGEVKNQSSFGFWDLPPRVDKEVKVVKQKQ